MSEMEQRLQELMYEWKLAHRERKWSSFISDGAVNASEYESSIPRICFFLKEAYTKNGDEDWNLTKWLNNGAITRMWSAVAEWTYGIRHTSEKEIFQKPNLTVQEKCQLLQSVAIVNVKKSNGNVQSDYNDLLQYAQADCDLLKRELDILDPDVIVCGNNSSLLRLIFGASLSEDGKVLADGQIDFDFMRKNGFVMTDKKIILDYYHPANQYPSMMNYYTVCGLYQQALKVKG